MPKPTLTQEICDRLYRIKIPLPETPLKSLNAYLVRGPRRHLLIDTGLNHPVCLAAMQAGLARIGVALPDLDIFVTHLHADHFGLVSRLATPATRIYFSRPDAEIVENWEGFGPMLAHAGRHGFPVDRLRAALEAHPGNRFRSEWVPPLEILTEGDVLEVGDFAFRCLATPGHTLGHTCLYEPSRKILVAGDHVLFDITPNIQCWSDTENPLQLYLQSLDKVAALEVDLVLPGHRRLMPDLRGRVRELQAHHRRRLEEALSILGAGPASAYATAARMAWDIRADDWAHFPVAQQWFATGEALSHLRYLEAQGRVHREIRQGIVNFRPAA
jgi:glyoxylase-like metal-dependent hydrolase (beta-lactamase superfamily II)